MRPTIVISLISLLTFSFCKNEQSKKGDVTWSSDVAPIIYKNCTSCHRPGEAGSFNLLSYYDAVARGKLIRFVTQSGYMPPWPADSHYSHFIGERVLTAHEKSIVKEWVDKGMHRGDSFKEPKPPVFYKGSFFRKPDLVVKAKEYVKIKGNGTDLFLIMKYPYRLERDTVVDFVEFVPDKRKLVHHVNGHLVNYDQDRSFDYFNGSSIHADTRSQVFDVYKEMHIPYRDNKQPAFPVLTPNVVYYLPGYTPPVYPSSLGGYKMKKNGLFLLNNLHYGPSNVDLIDSSVINVFFRHVPVKRPIQEKQLGTFGVSRVEPEFVIPPNEIKTFHTEATLSQDISLLSVNPHMHLIGKTFKAFAVKGNDTIHLIKIDKWDFRWQYYYTYPHPVKLSVGTTIHAYGTYDNTNSNPANPFHPPRTITQGNGVESMKTTEEMFQFIFSFVKYQEGDENIDLKKEPSE
jgi:hypothetical protein